MSLHCTAHGGTYCFIAPPDVLQLMSQYGLEGSHIKLTDDERFAWAKQLVCTSFRNGIITDI
jgi:hypothetical protein